ncbi:N-acetylmuramoyl-L-alanine amidase, partial [Clostridium perfringens]
ILNDGYEGASVIVECGFLSNPEECELLGKEDYQNKIANTLVNAIDEYFK